MSIQLKTITAEMSRLLVESAQVPVIQADMIADAVALRVVTYCWEQPSDIVSSDKHVGIAAGSTGVMPDVMLEIMCQSGLLLPAGNHAFFCPLATMLAGDGVRRKWMRTNRDNWDAAVKRSKGKIIRRVPRSSRIENDDDLLFGPSMPRIVREPRTDRPETQPGHNAFIRWYTEQYQILFRDKYPFRSYDAKIVQRVLELYDLDRLKQAARAFLDDRTVYTRGHSLSTFERQITRWMEESNTARRPHNKREHELENTDAKRTTIREL